MPQISSASYSGKDVTGIVKDLASSKGTFTVSNDALGGDPRPNVYKLLTVGYDDGTTRVAGEGQSLKLSTAQIVSASYSGKDVTGIVKDLAGSKGTFTVSNDALGGDPRPNVYKVLTVGYDDGTTRAAGEQQPLKLN
jgi:hypothetical protein